MHSKKYILSGIVVSNLIVIFISGFIFKWFWNLDHYNEQIALGIMYVILIVTIGSAIASYFWSHTEIPLNKLRLLAMINHFWIWFVLFFHNAFGYNSDLAASNLYEAITNHFFEGFFVFVIIFCSILGQWFGRRMFYE